MNAPYRDSGVHTCPQCGGPLDVPTGGPVGCANACGEWMPRAFVETMFDFAEIARAPQGVDPADVQAFAQAPCPACGAPLVRGWLGAAPIRVCAQHGVWIAQASQGRFETAMAAPMERHRRLLDLVELLAAADPASRREIARRLITLEDKVAGLEAALHALTTAR